MASWRDGGGWGLQVAAAMSRPAECPSFRPQAVEVEPLYYRIYGAAYAIYILHATLGKDPLL